MLRFVKGNLFDSEAQTLVNTVNTYGVMGKGVALEFKNRFQDMYEEYRKKCGRSEIQMGELTIYKESTPWVINFPTKLHWRSKSKLIDIKAGLEFFVEHYQEWGIKSLAMPALGCGHGGLDWEIVRALIVEYLENLEIDIEVYEPGSTVEQPEEPEYIENLFGQPVPPEKKRKRRKST